MTPEGWGGTDCEAFAGGYLTQPVNALSSLAYVLVGALLIGRARGLPRPARWLTGGGGLLAVLVGAGSFAYHGPQPSAGRLLHDVPVDALVAAAAAVVLARLARRRPVLPGADGRLAGLLAVTAAAAAAAYVLGRTGAPLCAPTSPLQGHALWHVLSAAVVGLGAAALTAAGAEAPTPARPIQPRERFAD